VDDSELMLLAFNTYEAFGALLGSPAAKAAKLTAMHMAVVIAHAASKVILDRIARALIENSFCYIRLRSSSVVRN